MNSLVTLSIVCNKLSDNIKLCLQCRVHSGQGKPGKPRKIREKPGKVREYLIKNWKVRKMSGNFDFCNK